METIQKSSLFSEFFVQLSKYKWILLVCVIMLGAGLRFYKLDFQGLWYDEIHSMNGADPDLTIAEIIEYAKTDQPPLFFLSLHLWLKIFDYNDFYGRMFSAIIGVMGIIAMYFLGREFKNSTAGIFAAMFTSLNYFHIGYSQEVRFYSMLFLAAALSFLFFLRALRNQSPWNLTIYVLTTAGALYVHYFGLVVFASQVIIFGIVLVLYGFNKKLFIRGMAAGFAVAILILPWAPQILSDSKLSFWVQLVKFPQFLFAYFYNYFGDKVLIYLYAILFIVFIGKSVMQAVKQKEKPPLEFVVLFGWLVLGYGIPLLYSFLVAPMLIVRYTIFILPAILVTLALAITSIQKKYLVVLITVVSIFFSLRSLFVIKDYYTKVRKQQWREIVKTVIENEKKPAIIFSYYSWHYNYYFKSLGATSRSINPSTINYQEELDKVDYVWLIQANENTIGANGQEISMIEKDFTVAKKVQLLDAGAVLYERKKDPLQPAEYKLTHK